MNLVPVDHYRLLFEASPTPFLVLTPEFKIVAVSDSYLRATMTRRHDIVGRGLFEVFPDNPNDAAATGVQNLRKSLNKVLSARQPDEMAIQKYDVRRPAEEGGAFEERYWSPLNTPVFNDKGEITYIVHRVEDVTERMRTREALRESDEHLRLLVNSVRDYAILMLDPSGQVASWNQGAERIKGYNANEIVGRHFSCFYPPEDVQNGKPEHELQRAIAEGRYEEEGWRIRKGGSRFWADVVITALKDGTGKLRGFSKITRDASERKKAQLQIEQQNRELELRNREVERATKLKSKFLATMSHELRTPLNAIVGFSELLAEETAGELNDKQKRFVGHIKQGSAHLLQLINDILDLSKIEAGQLELRCEDFQVKDALPEVLSTIRPLAMAKNIQVQHNLKT